MKDQASRPKAFLHFGGAFTGEPNAPRQTIEVEVKEKPLWFHKRGLMQTASGYGSKLATTYMVKYNNRWQRVYCAIYSNSGTCYIISKSKPLATVDIYNH